MVRFSSCFSSLVEQAEAETHRERAPPCSSAGFCIMETNRLVGEHNGVVEGSLCSQHEAVHELSGQPDIRKWSENLRMVTALQQLIKQMLKSGVWTISPTNSMFSSCLGTLTLIKIDTQHQKHHMVTLGFDFLLNT